MKHELVRQHNLSGRSPPMRGRGLKQSALNLIHWDVVSPPMRGRGLKRKSKVYKDGTADGLGYITSLSVFDFLMTCLVVFSLVEIMWKINRK